MSNKEDKKFSKMDEAVDIICKSLREEPTKWLITTNTFNKLGSDITYWKGSGDSPITKIWNGHSNEVVFSTDQGYRIRGALDTCLHKKATAGQEKILNEVIKPVIGDGAGSAHKKGFFDKLFRR